MDGELEQRLRELTKVFLAENEKLNLSAMRTEEACWHGNVLDSLSFLDLIKEETIDRPTTLIDVGTGGGFPLLPLAITLPETRFTGLDATKKKIDAVGRIVKALGMKNVTLVADRTETRGRDRAMRDMFDVATARAVAPLPILLEFVAPFVRVGGHAVLWKSTHIDDELAASEAAQIALHCRLAHTHEYELGDERGKRMLLIFAKEAPTPSDYPRAVGEAKRQPIG